MNTLTVTLPDSLHSQLQKLADQEGLSVDQLTASALAEKIAALMTTDYLTQRAKRGDRAGFEQALAKISTVEPEEHDTL